MKKKCVRARAHTVHSSSPFILRNIKSNTPYDCRVRNVTQFQRSCVVYHKLAPHSVARTFESLAWVQWLPQRVYACACMALYT